MRYVPLCPSRYYDAAIGAWTSQDPTGFDAGDSNLYRYAGNNPPNVLDPEGLEGITVVHATTPELAVGVVQKGLQAGKDGVIWLASPEVAGSGASRSATVHVTLQLHPQNIREVPESVIRDAGRAANKAISVQGLSGEARAAAWARAKGDIIAGWVKGQPEVVFKMPSPPNHPGGAHYIVKPEALATSKASIIKISGQGSGPAVEALTASHTARGAAAAGSAEAKAVEASARSAAVAKWGNRVVKVARVGGRIVVVVAAAADAYAIYTSAEPKKEAVKVAGGWGGAAAGASGLSAAGAAIGVWAFGVGAAPGALVGGIVGGIGGYFGGRTAAGMAYEWFFERGVPAVPK